MKTRSFHLFFWRIDIRYEVDTERIYRPPFWRYLKSLGKPRLTFQELGELYRMVPFARDALGTSGAVRNESDGIMTREDDRHAWGPPAFRPGGVLVSGWATCEQEKSALAAMPSWGHLTDEELAERLKTARLGEGIIAEAGYREAMKGGEESGTRTGEI